MTPMERGFTVRRKDLDPQEIVLSIHFGVEDRPVSLFSAQVAIAARG